MAEDSSTRQPLHEQPVRLSVNGTPVSATVEPLLTLANFLREKVSLTATHLNCKHEACGACTVLLDSNPKQSYLLFTVQVSDMDITESCLPTESCQRCSQRYGNVTGCSTTSARQVA